MGAAEGRYRGFCSVTLAASAGSEDWDLLGPAAAIVHNSNRGGCGCESRCESGLWPQLQGDDGKRNWMAKVILLIVLFNRKEIELLKRDKEKACSEMEELNKQVQYRHLVLPSFPFLHYSEIISNLLRGNRELFF